MIISHRGESILSTLENVKESLHETVQDTLKGGDLVSPHDSSMYGINETDELFRKAANIALYVWAGLLIIVYAITPTEELVYLSPGERHAAQVAFFTLSVATMLLLIPFVIQKRDKTKDGSRLSGIVYASIVVQCIAICTNALLGFFPVVVRRDFVTLSPVYMIRWCEWIPLSGLMTFLSEGIDLKKDKSSLRNAVVASSMQSLSCLTGGLLCPYAVFFGDWLAYMILSCSTYLAIFPRVDIKRQAYMSFAKGGSHYGLREKHDRLRFSYTLLRTCSIVWTVLVVFYFMNMFIHRVLDEDHPIREIAIAMILDTLFDVMAKALYMKWIVDVHYAVFDTEGRAMRQLSELRNLMSVLWNQSSDVIIVSVRHGNKIVAILSPSFLSLIGSENDIEAIQQYQQQALMMEIERVRDCEDNPQRGDEELKITKAVFLDTDEIPYEQWSTHCSHITGDELDTSNFIALNGRSLVAAAWHRASTVEEDGNLLTYPFETASGEIRQSEIKVSKHGPSAIVSVVRDVTERYRRFEAERRAHAEVLRRQKDAQSQTRFVRHEVKNGLLAGIELCDVLKNEIEGILHSSIFSSLPKEPKKTGTSTVAPLFPITPLFPIPQDSISQLDDIRSPDPSELSRGRFQAQKSQRSIENLDLLLHEVLETVLAEAMARDVINEIYKPRSESLDVFAVLTSSVSTKSGKTERFPIQVKGPRMPFLQMDPQLLRYIHRNAVSNAAKYGRPGGMVNTVLQYNPITKILKMDVINEPAKDQQRIMALGHEKANEIVFSQGATLHSNGSIISSGDGAWIISKCAKTMRGTCEILFEEHQTVFSFEAKVEPIVVDEIVSVKDFTVPPETFGIAVDDSKIQRKLMHRMLTNVGVKDNMLEVIGETPAEVMGLEEILLEKLNAHPDSKILILVDENLDYGSTNSEQADTAMISGSLTMQRILNDLSEEQERRILSLVRSANDSTEDVATYVSRTHGFIPKAPMHKERVREILAPLWTRRFMQKS